MLDRILVILVFAALIIVCAVSISRWKKKKNAQKKYYEDQIRLQILNQSIKNTMRKEVVQAVGEKRTDKNCGPGTYMLRLSIKTKNGIREYVLNPRERLVLGSQSDCTVVLEGEGIGSRQCELFEYHGDVYIKNLNARNNTVLQRRNKKARVDNTGYRICTGDQILAGRCRMQVDLLDFSGRPLSN